MRLHENPDDFKNLIRAASQNLKIREVYVEKDYWLTFLLYRLTQLVPQRDVVFKGGTSLSKGYKLIRRFRPIQVFRQALPIDPALSYLRLSVEGGGSHHVRYNKPQPEPEV